ncbi:MAG: DUF190 domain-containing protein [Alicyclobacillaceae bacterium]|nr:DUF190 domain-containing protein [Alicyclobacillaceae bacterium]
MQERQNGRGPVHLQAHLRCAVGIWNGARTNNKGQLLFRALADDARNCGVRECTVSGSIEGGRADRLFRSVESEVGSNELPVWLEAVDEAPVVHRWLPRLQAQLGSDGIVVVEAMMRWTPPGARPGTTAKEGRDTAAARMPEHSSPEYGSAVRGLHVQLFTLESRRVNGKPVYQAVAEFLRRRRVLWMSTSRGLCGFAEGRLHYARKGWFSRSDAPVVMHIVDREDVLAACLPELVSLVDGRALLVSAPVELYAGLPGNPSGR